jgi:hypothetical protein
VEPQAKKVLPPLSAATLPITARESPGLRASSQDRDNYIDVVKQAFADGQLDRTEMEDRIDQVIASKTLADLPPALDGLNLARLTVGDAVAVPEPATTVAVPKTKQSLPLKIKVLIASLAAALVAALGIGVAYVAAENNWFRDNTSWTGQQDPQNRTSQDEIPADFEQWVGEITQDYSNVLVTHDASHTITLRTGELTVIFPADANVVVNWKVTFGEYNGKTNNAGAGMSGTDSWTPNPGGPTLTFDVTVNAGTLTVRTR